MMRGIQIIGKMFAALAKIAKQILAAAKFDIFKNIDITTF